MVYGKLYGLLGVFTPISNNSSMHHDYKIQIVTWTYKNKF